MTPNPAVVPTELESSGGQEALSKGGGWKILATHARTVRSSDFARKVFETYATRLLLMVLGLVSTVIAARLLGPEGRGFYAVAIAAGALGVQFGNLGLHCSNVYFAAREPQSMGQLVGNSLAVSFGVGGLIAVAIVGLLTVHPDWISLRGATLLLVLVWIPFNLAYLLLQNLMLGVQDVRGYNLFEVVNKAFALILIFALVISRWVSVASFFATGVVASVVSCVLLLVRLRAHFVGVVAISFALFRQSIRYALKAFLAGFFCFLVLRADLFMVEHMLGPVQAGYYSVASTMADYVSVLAVVISSILFPKLSALTDASEKLRITWKAVWGTTLLLIPMLLAVSVLAKPTVRVLFGVAFLPASFAFVLLMPGMLFLGINTVAVQFLNSIGYPKIVVVIWGLCSLVNIGLNVWVIPRFGITGASVVSTISYTLAFILNALVIQRTANAMRQAPAAA